MRHYKNVFEDKTGQIEKSLEIFFCLPSKTKKGRAFLETVCGLCKLVFRYFPSFQILVLARRSDSKNDRILQRRKYSSFNSEKHRRNQHGVRDSREKNAGKTTSFQTLRQKMSLF